MGGLSKKSYFTVDEEDNRSGLPYDSIHQRDEIPSTLWFNVLCFPLLNIGILLSNLLAVAVGCRSREAVIFATFDHNKIFLKENNVKRKKVTFRGAFYSYVSHFYW